jgi:hypothetical protein
MRSIAERLRPLRREIGAHYQKWSLDRKIASLPLQAIVPIEEATDVLLLCSRIARNFDGGVYIKELAFAQELAARGRAFAVSTDPSRLFGKSVAWFLPNHFVSPRLWDYSRQVYEFASGLERQGNHLFCSSDETLYWENKAYMHDRLAELGIPTPRTEVVTADSRGSLAYDFEPMVLKEEHSAGSAGIHYFAKATEARAFVANYRFRPRESLIMQEVVRGATRDLRLTIVGDEMIRSATYWRTKRTATTSSTPWTTTATTYGSVVEHGNVPEPVVRFGVDSLRQLGLRTAGIDLMWVDDDLSGQPLLLELSPYYQPNPPKPERYADWTYNRYKSRPLVADGYFAQQHRVLREIAAKVLDQALY